MKVLYSFWLFAHGQWVKTPSPVRHYSLRLVLLIFSDPWERWLRLQEELLPWASANVLEATAVGGLIYIHPCAETMLVMPYSATVAVSVRQKPS